MKSLLYIGCILLLFSCSTQKNQEQIFDLPKIIKSEDVVLSGNPKIISDSIMSVSFNGTDDAIFIDTMPLKGLTQFTIEAVFFPEKDGRFEQRFLHFGEINKDRVLLEIRANEDSWYFDSFICAGGNKLALIDSTLTHPLNKWYHVAFVVDNGNLTSYVNGKKELSGKIEMTPLTTGKMSIGVRLNKVCWFKGKISSVKITSKALNPEAFSKSR
jgi:hypothetical protein